MTTSPSEPVDNDQSTDASDTVPPDVADEDLPDDLQPSEDNPLAVNPDEEKGGEGETTVADGGPREDDTE